MIFSLCFFFFLNTILAATLHCILWQLIKIITHVLIRPALIIIISNKILTCRKLYMEFVFCRYLCNQMRWEMYIVCTYICTYVYMSHISFSISEFFQQTSVQYKKQLICYHNSDRSAGWSPLH